MKQYLETGKIVTVQGLKGDVRVNPWADSPDFLLQFHRIYLDDQGNETLEVERVRVQKNVVIMKFFGVDTIEQANRYRNRVIYVDRGEVRLAEGEYYIQDLIGLQVMDADMPDLHYGTLTQVSPTGANDVYHLEKEGKIYLIPAISEVVISTDLTAGVMKIRPIKGLFDHED